MPDRISRERLKKKALERWENEGGRIYADRIAFIESDSPNKGYGDPGIRQERMRSSKGEPREEVYEQ